MNYLPPFRSLNCFHHSFVSEVIFQTETVSRYYSFVFDCLAIKWYIDTSEKYSSTSHAAFIMLCGRTISL
jgi:hypothetical protein